MISLMSHHCNFKRSFKDCLKFIYFITSFIEYWYYFFKIKSQTVILKLIYFIKYCFHFLRSNYCHYHYEYHFFCYYFNCQCLSFDFFHCLNQHNHNSFHFHIIAIK